MATAEPKYIYQLVTVQDVGEEPTEVVFGDSLDNNNPVYADWDADGNGHLRKIQEQDAMLQTTIKMIFTEKQASGYGTHIYDFIGVKDLSARRLSLFMDLTFGIMKLKNIIDAIAVSQNLAQSDRILTVQRLSVVEDEADPTRLNASLVLKNNDGTTTSVGVL